MKNKIAALMTCYNRKEKTKQCLNSLFNISSQIDVFLVDDGSTDGTSEMVKENFPFVNVINGTGSLFWSRGMYYAWKEALKYDYDYYLWLNDDTILLPHVLDELMKCNQQNNNGHCIISGLIADVDTGKIIYGGPKLGVKEEDYGGKSLAINQMNGNVVLIPRSVVLGIGIIDPIFLHGGADTDYGYSAQKAHIPVLSTTRVVAMGYSNNFDRLRKWNTNIINRFRFLYSPMGTQPRIGFYLFKKHFGVLKAIEYWVYLHLINLFPDKITKFLWKGHLKNLDLK